MSRELLLLLFITGGCTSCPIKLTPPSVVVQYGHPAAINCSTLSGQSQKMGWEARKGGVSLRVTTAITWTVDSVTEWNAPPMCYMEFSNNSHCLIQSTVVVYTFPDSIRIDSTAGPSRSMKEHTTYNFTCGVPVVAPVGNLTVKLYRGDAVIETRTFNDTIKEPVSKLSVIPFVPSRHDDGVEFRCEAILDLEKHGGPKLNVSSEPYRVAVTFGPVVSCLNSSYEGDTLGNLCSVIGNPTPFVTWRKDGKPVNSTLALSRGYKGEYVIEAEGASLVTKVLRPDVMYKPELDCPNVYTVPEHAPFSFGCSFSGNPVPIITIFKDNEVVALPENLTRWDGGQYSIFANSSIGVVNTTVDVTVVYPPSRIAELEDTVVNAGSPFWLKCSSTGNPRPRYQWTYYRTEGALEESDDGVSRLLVHNATALNAGSYTCRAWNDRGSTQKTVNVLVKGAEPECPIKISVENMVIPYQSAGRNVQCGPTAPGSSNIVGKVSWQLAHGNKTESTQLFVDPHKDWDLQASCTATFQGLGTCQKPFHLTLYKMPDSVSVTRLDNLSSVVENQQFQLRCDITAVAPARHLVVRWFQGNKTVPLGGKESLHVTGCPSEKVPGCNVSTTRHPVNMSSTITVALDRSDSGTTFWCEAQLELGLEILPAVSSPLNITVNYKPTIDITMLPKVVPLFHGYPEELSCKAEGYPPPKIQWFYSADKFPRVSGDMLVVTEAGYYNCTATNEVNTTFRVVEVILKEDYLPLIAGLVAITVIAISVVFVFIYSIYYKNTKMRRYSLKNPKHNPQNGNVAHNSWDSQFSMAKLS